ncbi:hypothetical protein [Sphingomonas sp.]|uniref:hypothetical protein n=1 Tax=Sphingomonas sp. TaxID=28214 RepID=UPI00286DB430|nr:hypothetical protein [Sphingomonas sp.]
MPNRAKRFLIASAALALALPALAQDRPEPVAAQNSVAPSPQPSPGASPAATTPPRTARDPGGGEGGFELVDISELSLEPPPPPVELPDHARRDPMVAGTLDPAELGLGANPWGDASGAFLSTLMRRMETPIASRWAHMALRNAVLAAARAPRHVNPVDWTAERAWLLLRLGEADAARMLVAGVDVDEFTPKMFQVAVQSALANADPPGLCPLEDGIRDVERRVMPLVEAMCAALAGEPESAAAQIESARRRGLASGIDLVLAQKVVGAGADTGSAATVEWEPVRQLNSWRFGLATATGMTLPENLVRQAPLRLRAWQARAPLLSPEARLASARLATGLGVFSSQSLIDLYSQIYDRTDPDDLSESDAWQLRMAFVGKDRAARLAAMRRLWDKAGDDRLEREASRALLGRAAARIAPDPELQSDAPQLIASMLAAGYDREAARWAGAVRRMDDEFADRCWAMLALAAPNPAALDIGYGRVNSFISRDKSPGRKRGALLVAALAGSGRLDARSAARLNNRHGLRLERASRWTRMIDGAAARGQGGSALVMAGTGLQGASFEDLPPAHLFHAVAALRRTRQDFIARMIAAEALART